MVLTCLKAFVLVVCVTLSLPGFSQCAYDDYKESSRLLPYRVDVGDQNDETEIAVDNPTYADNSDESIDISLAPETFDVGHKRTTASMAAISALMPSFMKEPRPRMVLSTMAKNRSHSKKPKKEQKANEKILKKLLRKAARTPSAKRSPNCMRKCMAQGLLHPAQCHSLC